MKGLCTEGVGCGSRCIVLHSSRTALEVTCREVAPGPRHIAVRSLLLGTKKASVSSVKRQGNAVEEQWNHKERQWKSSGTTRKGRVMDLLELQPLRPAQRPVIVAVPRPYANEAAE